MAWHYLPELLDSGNSHSSRDAVGVYLEQGCSDGYPSVLWKKSRTDERCCSAGSGTACFPCSQSGTTCEPSTGNRGVEKWISSQPVSLVNRGLSGQENSRAPVMNGICGRTPFASLEKSGPGSSCWRTLQKSLFTDTQIQFSGTWPRAGIVCRGTAYRLPPLVPIIREIDFGLWPTPCARDYKGTSAQGRRRNNPSPDTLPDAIAQILGIPLDQSGVVDPIFTERLMLLPTMWSALNPLALPKYQQWLEQHGCC